MIAQLDQFWRRVTEGLEVSQLWGQFKKDATTSYRLYHRDYTLARRPARENSFWEKSQGLAWAILEKLTPARRVLLLIGVLLLLFPSGGFSYRGRSGEVQAVEFDFHFAGGAVLFVLLMLEIADRVVMKRDLEIARDIQKWLLPAVAPKVPGISVAFATRAANTVAGYFYDVFPRQTADPTQPSYLLAVADVAGKSIPAALLMATFQASLRTLSSVPCTLEQLASGMNRYACTNSQGGLRFTTAFLAEYDPTSGSLAYINAGHNPPVLRRSTTGAVEHLEAGGLPLGIQDDAVYRGAQVTLQRGDWLIIFTDGVVEAVDGREIEFGEERMIAVVEADPGATPDDALRRMIEAIDTFVGNTPQHDDITCVLVKAG
jgi:sigma-B regulation protein RsbU (phosphoserine phosphatase)